MKYYKFSTINKRKYGSDDSWKNLEYCLYQSSADEKLEQFVNTANPPGFLKIGSPRKRPASLEELPAGYFSRYLEINSFIQIQIE